MGEAITLCGQTVACGEQVSIKSVLGGTIDGIVVAFMGEGSGDDEPGILVKYDDFYCSAYESEIAEIRRTS